jgi:hypothetical protein
MLLKNWPTSSACVVGQRAGLVGAEKSERHRTARMEKPSASTANAGTSHR